MAAPAEAEFFGDSQEAAKLPEFHGMIVAQ
jgi:hypothetical protein